MPSYAHKKLVEEILKLDAVPSDANAFSAWIKAQQHLDFLKDNGRQNEIVVYASGPFTFIHSMIVPNSKLSPPNENDLLGWSCNPFTSIASYVSGGGREGMWIERGPHGVGSDTLASGMNLIFGRDFHGLSGPDGIYFEVNQEFTHLTEIHWRPEERAYCRFDNNGDLSHSVSISKWQGDGGVSLVSFEWAGLEEYLAASDCSLVRLFDFTLLRREDFTSWPKGPEHRASTGPDFFYRQKVCAGHAAYTRGVQILGCRRKSSDILKDVTNRWFGKEDRQHAEFLADDWRNKRVVKISTDPAATTNYFDAKENDLPFELSPAFFKPEVLLKYKTDRDKYTIEERQIRCRAAWYLKGYDVNEAGQVHAYICDLRQLPYSEQLHWLSFNEAPKGGISERAFINDFKGEWTKTTKPLRKVTSILEKWRERKVSWWTVRDEALFERVSVPYSSSRDEWADSFLELTKLVNEGFEVKAIRKVLASRGIPYEEKDQSIVLLEKLLGALHGSEQEDLPGLRAAQRVRSKVKGHTSGSAATEITQAALAEHETFASHFEHVCEQIAEELIAIESVFEGKKLSVRD